MKYPAFYNVVTRERIKGDSDYYRFTNRELGVDMEITKKLANFAICLDGKTDPYSIIESRERVDQYLEILESNGLLIHNRISREGLVWTLSLAFHQYPSVNKRCSCFVYSSLLALSFLPVLILGIYLAFSNYNKASFFSTNYTYLYIGEVIGTVLGAIMHEFGHYSSTIGYGGEILEVGTGIELIFPIAYIKNDVSKIRNRLFRIQINAAGVESNFLLSGLLFMFCGFKTDFSFIVLGAALCNLILGIVNSLPLRLLFMELDGAHILQDVTGDKNIIPKCFKNTFIKTQRQKIVHSRHGLFKFAGSLFITILHILLVSYYIFTFIEIIRSFF